MAAEALVGRARGILTQAMVAAGRDLVTRVRDRIQVTAAFWLYIEERGRWRLMIVTPMVAQKGTAWTYQQVQIALEDRAERRPYGMNDLELDDVTVIDPSNELIRLWRSVYPEGIRASETRATGISIAGHYFEDAYFYLL